MKSISTKSLRLFCILIVLSMTHTLFCQKVGINTSSPQNPLHVKGNTQIQGKLGINQQNVGSIGGDLIYSIFESVSESSDSADHNIILYEDSSFGPWLNFAHARGNRIQPMKLEYDDKIFGLFGHAFDGANFNMVGGIEMKVDSSTGINDLPTKLSFYTTPNGSTSMMERMNIAHDGRICIGNEINASQELLNVQGNTNLEGRLTFRKNLSNSIYIGEETGLNDNGAGNLNTFVGNGAGKDNVNGFSNVYIGNNAGNKNVTGNSNLAIGEASLASNLGSYNTALGKFALHENDNGNGNTALGNYAGFGSTGDNNFFLGTAAGEGTTGNGNVFIGNEVGAYANVSNRLFIDNSNTDKPLIEGDFALKNLTVNGQFQAIGAMGMRVKSGKEIGIDHPDTSASMWIYTGGSGNIDLPSASSVTNMMYIIVNKTLSSCTISVYQDLLNISQTNVVSGGSLWLVSDGSVWQQIK